MGKLKRNAQLLSSQKRACGTGQKREKRDKSVAKQQKLDNKKGELRNARSPIST